MDKSAVHIIIKITNKGVFYNEDDFIEWGNTNFPPKDEFSFNERKTIYWKAKLISFDRASSQLKVDIVDYNVGHKKEIFSNQKPKFSFQRMWFKKLRWQELESIMNIYTQILFDEISDSGDQATIPVGGRGTMGIGDPDWIFEDDRLEKNIRIDVNFTYPLKKTKFKMGYVEIEKKLKGSSDKVNIHLNNNNVIPEFDHIKPFFAKVLETKKIEVIGYLEKDEKGSITAHCQSKEINRINEELITTVRRLNLNKSIFKPKIIVVDKSLFTPEEYFEGIEEERLGNTVRKDYDNILEEILQLEGIRNQKQLKYLSGKLQSKSTGLRFTLSPKFGFLFHVEGEEMDHFIWELLNTNATYIWSVDKKGFSLDMKLKLVEMQVNFIRDNGRRVYLDSQKNENIIFSRVMHENSKAGVVGGFPKWKVRVNEKLV